MPKVRRYPQKHAKPSSPIHQNRFYRNCIVGARTKEAHITDSLPNLNRTRKQTVKEIDRLLKSGQIVLILGLPGIGKTTADYKDAIVIPANLNNFPIPDFKNYCGHLMRLVSKRLGLSSHASDQEIKKALGGRALILDDPERLFDHNKIKIYPQLVSYLNRHGMKFGFISPFGRENLHTTLLNVADASNVTVVEMLPFNREETEEFAKEIAARLIMKLPANQDFLDRLYALSGGIAELIKLLIVNLSTIGPDLKYCYLANTMGFKAALDAIYNNLFMTGFPTISLMFEKGELQIKDFDSLPHQIRNILTTYLRYGILRIKDGKITVRSEILRDEFFS